MYFREVCYCFAPYIIAWYFECVSCNSLMCSIKTFILIVSVLLSLKNIKILRNISNVEHWILYFYLYHKITQGYCKSFRGWTSILFLESEGWLEVPYTGTQHPLLDLDFENVSFSIGLCILSISFLRIVSSHNYGSSSKGGSRIFQHTSGQSEGIRLLDWLHSNLCKSPLKAFFVLLQCFAIVSILHKSCLTSFTQKLTLQKSWNAAICNNIWINVMKNFCIFEKNSRIYM